MLAGIVKKYSISEKDIKLVEIKPFEIISLDCTEALRNTTYIGHLNLKRCINMRSQFLNDSIADKNTVLCLIIFLTTEMPFMMIFHILHVKTDFWYHTV